MSANATRIAELRDQFVRRIFAEPITDLPMLENIPDFSLSPDAKRSMRQWSQNPAR